MTNPNDSTTEQNTPPPSTEGTALNWGTDTPKGGKAVMNRVLKEGATVPLFFAQTLIKSLRDVGYNHTTSALCEHVDNSIQAKASEVRIFFRQTGAKGGYQIDAAVYDNGHGMASNVLKVVTAFGGSMSYGNRAGIARFGMGMKTAALSMSPVMDLYSWQEPGAYYNMILDVEEIGKERANLVELPDPRLISELPDEIADFFRKPLSFPADSSEQTLLVEKGESLADRLGRSGTIVYMPDCDRLTSAKSSTLVDHAIKEMSRIYRRHIANGLKLYINNRLVEAFDPTYSMPNARHVRLLKEATAKQSRLIVAKPVKIPVREGGKETSTVTIKLYRLPIEEWSVLSKKEQKNDLRIFDGFTVSILRNDRELFAGPMPRLTTRHNVANWYRLQIDFEGILDEAFGVAANKQGIRMKGYVEEAIKNGIEGEITTINNEIKRFQAEQASIRRASKPSPSEAKATETDSYQPTEIPSTPEEAAQIDDNLRGLAVSVKRGGETDEQALERVKSSKYIIVRKHDEYWPFYDVKHQFGRVILTLNTAHPFFSQLYEPLQKIEPRATDDDGQESALPIEPQQGPLLALELLLLSLARTQSRLSDKNEDSRKVLEEMRREWSNTYRIQLTN
jgi:hypothetical protein